MSLTTERTEPVSILQRERQLRPDLFLVLAFLALGGIGIVMVHTASAPRLELLGADPATLMRRQAVFGVVGVAVFIVASLIDSRTLRTATPWLFGGSMVSLLLVLTAVGEVVKGAQRWVQIGPFQFQPSEFSKVALILALAALLSSAGERLRWDQVARAVILVALPAVLIFRQPDLGTMLVLGFITFAVLFVAGTTVRQLGFLTIAGVVSAIGLFRAGALREYQVTRLVAFLDPAADTAAAQYNQAQSEIAIGSGGFFGKGLFEGTQTNLSFVPEQSTDFIFTAVGEQLGFVGGTIVLALFAIIVWRVLVAAAVGRDRFSQLASAGVAALVMFHVFVNVGMTIGLMPVTGLPLPFLSAGGSAFIAMSFSLGLAHSSWMRRSPVPGEHQLR
jgi:rod shape determining protein RodA